MDILINVALLTVAFAGAAIAFAGDTTDKTAKPLLARVTRVGWASIILLLLAFGLGVAKEVRERLASAKRERAAKAEEDRRVAAEQALAMANGRLIEANLRLKDLDTRLEVTTQKLVRAEVKIDRVKPEVVKAVATLTQDIPREVDDGWLGLHSESETVPISRRTGRPLILFGGDDFEYYSYCDNGNRYEMPAGIPGVYIELGTRRYLMDQNHGVWRVAGPTGQPLRARIVNPMNRTCNIKWQVRSTVSRRSRHLLESALSSSP